MKTSSSGPLLALGALALGTSLFVASARRADSQVSTLPAFIRLQPATPGTAQAGHGNITGTFIAGNFSGAGGNLTGLNASNITSGTLADGRLSANVMLLNNAQTVTGAKTFSASPSFTNATPFSVSSTTKVTNLNADYLDGLSSSAFLLANPPVTISGSLAGGTILSVTNTSAAAGSDAIAATATGSGFALDALRGTGGAGLPNNPAIYGNGDSYGVIGNAANNGGVGGFVEGTGGYGVWGQAIPTGSTGGRFSNSGSGEVVDLAGPNGALHMNRGFAYKNYVSGTKSACIPIAYGFIDTTGAVVSGSGNFACTWTGSRYEITITGESYFFNLYTTVATGVSTPQNLITVSSVSGKLLVYSYDNAGNLDQRWFQFVTYKTDPTGFTPRPPNHGFDDDAKWAQNRPKEFAAFMKTVYGQFGTPTVQGRPGAEPSMAVQPRP